MVKSRILCVVLLLAIVATIIAPAGVFTASAAITTPVAEESTWNTVVDGWYISNDGGFKFYVGTWTYYGSYGITLVETSSIPTNCCTIAVYDADSDEVFENKTQADFETVLQETATVFEKRTIGNSNFTMYYCKTASYENYVFQANGKKYFINFICISDISEFAAGVMDTIVIADDEPAFEGIKSVSHEIVDGKVIFTVVTTASDYNRVKAAVADNANGYVGYASTYEVNADGDYVWTIKAAASTEPTKYVFDMRSDETGLYLKEYYEYDVEVSCPETIKSVSYEVANGKVVFTVVTGAGEYNRVKVAYADNAKGYVAYTNDYEVNADGDYVWTIKTAAPAESTSYVFDIRSATSRKYLKAYFECDVEIVPTFKSVDAELVDDKVIFTITTIAGNFGRVKLAYADDVKGYVAYTKSYEVNADGDYVWTIRVDAPTETTSYALDISSTETNAYNRSYYYFDYAIVEYPDPTVEDNWKKVVDDVFTSDKGGLQMYAAGWQTYGLYSISMVPAGYTSGATNAISVAVYDADSEEVFANKTQADFETVLQTTLDSFEAITVCGYPAYKAVATDMYYVWVINTPTHKYFINFMQVAGQADMNAIGEAMIATAVIYK